MFTFSTLQRITGGKLSCITSNLNLTAAGSKMKLVVMVMSKNNNRNLTYLLNKRSSQVSTPFATRTGNIRLCEVTTFAS